MKFFQLRKYGQIFSYFVFEEISFKSLEKKYTKILMQVEEKCGKLSRKCYEIKEKMISFKNLQFEDNLSHF